MTSSGDASTWPGAPVRGRGDTPLGRVDHVYVDRLTGRPTFAAVRVARSSSKAPLLPVELLHVGRRGLTADVSLPTLAAAPEASGRGALHPAEEAAVHDHYGVGGHAGGDAPRPGGRSS